ncbi:hypothetical protein N482_13280 [Pseudoalteromonas luteoviolacea NCIMB 1942]|uniref:Uncharacterized protein n=1 Tax=Pseudoalteromonas luteoviolacea NCIMB 1942 TaxID=1365253 RepID=A0A167B0V2_9GAMM|nr:hypothetical protein N482_13280 [Pseudoalteromonas luteoviolacea NCIMB 1942]
MAAFFVLILVIYTVFWHDVEKIERVMPWQFYWV